MLGAAQDGADFVELFGEVTEADFIEGGGKTRITRIFTNLFPRIRGNW
jgi:hypothetical protein